MLIVVEKFWNFAWAEPLKNKTGNSILKTFAKILSRGGLKTLFLYTDRGLEFANKLFLRYLKKKQIHFLTAQNQETKSSITERLIRTLWFRIRRYFTFKDTLTCFQIFTILQCYISSQHKTKSSPMAVAQPTRDCAANRSSLSNGAVQFTSRYKQILLPPLNFFFTTQVLLCSFVSWKYFQVCHYITLDKLLFQICVVVLHFVKVNTRIFL